MADYLAHPATTFPLTISIEGEWGAGKTSFMLQLQRRLQKRGFASVWFEPWTHRQPESLWAAFALTCVQHLTRGRSPWVRPLLKGRLVLRRLKARILSDLGWRLLYVVGLITVLWIALQGGMDIVWATLRQLTGGQPANTAVLDPTLKILTLLFALIPALKELYGGVAGLLEADLKRYINAPDYASHQGLLARLHEDFKAVLDTYSGGKRVVVFVDDLDRCAPDVVAEMMQAINLLMNDDPRMVFIIGLDRELVAAAFAARNDKLLPFLAQSSLGTTWGADAAVGLSFGLSYLEKFITIPFRLPMLAEQGLDRLMDSLLPRHLVDTPRLGLLLRFRLWLSMLGWRPQALFTDKAAEVAAGRAEVEELEDYEFAVSAAMQERRERLSIELYEDSATIRQCVAMVAPLFGYNPRRLKQFLNVLRLRAYMAGETGLFDIMGNGPDAPSRSPLTLPQLAKLVAIGLKWPGFFREVQAVPDGMRSLAWLTQEVIDADTVPVPIQRWAENALLADLLRAGCYNAEEELDLELRAHYGLDSVDLAWFAAISPQVLRRGGTIIKDKPRNLTQRSLVFWRQNRHRLGRVVRAVMKADIEPDGYHLRLIDEHDNEMWLSGVNAGYPGEGPDGAVVILADAGFGGVDGLRMFIRVPSNASFDVQRALEQAESDSAFEEGPADDPES